MDGTSPGDETSPIDIDDDKEVISPEIYTCKFGDNDEFDITQEEKDLIARVKNSFPIECSNYFLIKTVRSLKHKSVNKDDVVNLIVNAVLDYSPDEENNTAVDPEIGCANKPIGSERNDGLILPIMNSKSIMEQKEKSEIDKAIAESLLASHNTRMALSYRAAWPDDLRDMLKEANEPSGIHNVGQSCWFSVVAQLLFRLPKYRYVLFNVNPDECAREEDEVVSNLEMLKALRSFFALMEGTTRKFLDPTDILTTISDISKRRDGREILNHQQDAMELLIRIIEWIEDAATKKASPVPPPLVIGETIKAADRLESMEISPPLSIAGEAMDIHSSVSDLSSVGLSNPNRRSLPMESQDSMDDQHPLQSIFLQRMIVRKLEEDGGFKEYNDKLVMHLLNVEFENLHDALEDSCFSENSEMWTKSAPDAMIISLNRFQFDTIGGSAKIHSAFRFPFELYLDRYLLKNAPIVLEARKKLGRMREILSELRAKIDGHLNYPVGTGTMPLDDILQATLSFYHNLDQGPAPIILNPGKSFLPITPRRLPTIDQNSVTEEVSQCLLNLLENCQQNLVELRKQQEEMEKEIENIYEREDLKQNLYNLQSVVIHEGETNMGHYWIYCKDDNGKWRKMNDRRMEDATVEQIIKDGYGQELPTTSAYGLVYVKADLQPLDGISLPEDVKQTIEDHNLEFDEEIAKQDGNNGNRNDAAVLSCPESPRVNILDAALLGEPLDKSVASMYTSEYERSRAETKIKKLRFYLVNLYGDDYTFEKASRNCALSLMNNCGNAAIHTLEPETLLGDNLDNLEEAIASLKEETAYRLYNALVERWYEVVQAADSDCKTSVLHFWQVVADGMFAKVHRYIVLLALSVSRLNTLTIVSADELRRFENQTLSKDYIKQAEYAMCIYDLLRITWAYAEHFLIEIDADDSKLDINDLNDYSTLWAYRLRLALSCHYCQGVLLEECRILSPSQVDMTKSFFTIPDYIYKAMIVIPFLKLFSFIIFCFINNIDDEELMTQMKQMNELFLDALCIISRVSREEAKDGNTCVYTATMNHLQDRLEQCIANQLVTNGSVRMDIVHRMCNTFKNPNRGLSSDILRWRPAETNVMESVKQVHLSAAKLQINNYRELMTLCSKLTSSTVPILLQNLQK